jgi:photosystem II stability/assembly factor-like uncharacterized protein
VSADDETPGGHPAMLFGTSNGGVTWQQLAAPPDLAGVVVGGPAPVPQLLFTTLQDGWAVTGPLEGPDATTSNPGGVLYRTTDGGSTWSVAPGLPSHDMTLPTFFGPDDGVVLRDPTSPSRLAPTVFVTHDGGARWSAVAVPAAAGASYKGGALMSGRFSAASATHWYVVDDTKLYETNDGGRHWTTSVATPAFAASSALFTSDHDGLAVGQFARCPSAATPTHPNPPSCYPLLVQTADGGHHWHDAKL